MVVNDRIFIDNLDKKKHSISRSSRRQAVENWEKLFFFLSCKFNQPAGIFTITLRLEANFKDNIELSILIQFVCRSAMCISNFLCAVLMILPTLLMPINFCYGKMCYICYHMNGTNIERKTEKTGQIDLCEMSYTLAFISGCKIRLRFTQKDTEFADVWGLDTIPNNFLFSKIFQALRILSIWFWRQFKDFPNFIPHIYIWIKTPKYTNM